MNHRRGLTDTRTPYGTHGYSHPRRPEYGVWMTIKARCLNPKWPGYKNYGGRGITICERWRDSFLAFYEDMGPRPEGLVKVRTGYSVERIDNDKGYEPDNCRWGTTYEQNRNRRDNQHVTFRGETRILTDWAQWAGMPQTTLFSRLGRGWTFERAITEPIVVKHGLRK